MDLIERILAGKVPSTPDALNFEDLTLAASTTETDLVAGTAGKHTVCLYIHIVNTSATPARIDFRDSEGGTVRAAVYVPATSAYTYNIPFVGLTSGGDITAQSSASVSSILIYTQYFKFNA